MARRRRLPGSHLPKAHRSRDQSGVVAETVESLEEFREEASGGETVFAPAVSLVVARFSDGAVDMFEEVGVLPCDGVPGETTLGDGASRVGAISRVVEGSLERFED